MATATHTPWQADDIGDDVLQNLPLSSLKRRDWSGSVVAELQVQRQMEVSGEAAGCLRVQPEPRRW